MVANRSENTGPEIRLRLALFALGFRYRKHRRITVGTDSVRPDIVFVGPRVAVFVDGCFWHACDLHRTVPVTNRPFWERKLRLNVVRDHHQQELLERAGWAVARVWEHEDTISAADRIAGILRRAMSKTRDSRNRQ
jgi:DNA mismatch endonuclease (patch repair protein)